MGLTVLETVANPYTTALGPKEFGPFRINLAQSLNGIGWMLGPVVGGAFFYSAGGTEFLTNNSQLPYIGDCPTRARSWRWSSIAQTYRMLYRLRTRAMTAEPDATRESIWQRPHFVGAVLAQFLYVAAQAGIFSFFINYMVAEIPPLPQSWADGLLGTGLSPRARRALHQRARRGRIAGPAWGLVCFCSAA